MDNLTLEILSQYLANGVKVQYEGITNLKELSEWSKREPKTQDVLGEEYQKWVSERPENITGLRHSAIKQIRILKNYVTIQVGRHHNYSKKVGLNEVKLCLCPLSNFTDINSKSMNDLNLDLEDQIDLCQLANGNISVNALLHGIAVECFKNHIDIYGLIDKGLAVDINTLGKEDQNV